MGDRAGREEALAVLEAPRHRRAPRAALVLRDREPLVGGELRAPAVGAAHHHEPPALVERGQRGLEDPPRRPLRVRDDPGDRLGDESVAAEAGGQATRLDIAGAVGIEVAAVVVERGAADREQQQPARPDHGRSEPGEGIAAGVHAVDRVPAVVARALLDDRRLVEQRAAAVGAQGVEARHAGQRIERVVALLEPLRAGEDQVARSRIDEAGRRSPANDGAVIPSMRNRQRDRIAPRPAVVAAPAPEARVVDVADDLVPVLAEHLGPGRAAVIGAPEHRGATVRRLDEQLRLADASAASSGRHHLVHAHHPIPSASRGRCP